MALIQFRRGSAQEWTDANPVLGSGEPGFETDTRKVKIGDGATTWQDLAYIGSYGELPDGLLPRHMVQEAPDQVTWVFELDPFDPNVAPFQVVHKSFANGGGKPANNGVWIGYNAERYLQDGSGQDGNTGWHMGLESGYHNPDDGTYGPEWYLNYVSPDGTSVPIATMRPLYVRLGEAGTNQLGDKWAHVLVDIGGDPEGVFAVSDGYVHQNHPLLFVKTKLTRLGSDNVVVDGRFLTVRPAAADTAASLVLDSTGNRVAVIAMRVAGAPAAAFVASTPNTFYIADKADKPVLVFNYGTAVTSRQVNLRSRLKVDGVIEAGGAVEPSLVTGTGSLGVRPRLVEGGNAVRGVIEFGTGPGYPRGGDAIIIQIPSTYTTVPTIVVSPNNAETAALAPYAYAIDKTSFRIGLGNTPPGGKPVGTFAVTYQIVG
jgi:hypothetical protein